MFILIKLLFFIIANFIRLFPCIFLPQTFYSNLIPACVNVCLDSNLNSFLVRDPGKRVSHYQSFMRAHGHAYTNGVNASLIQRSNSTCKDSFSFFQDWISDWNARHNLSIELSQLRICIWNKWVKGRRLVNTPLVTVTQRMIIACVRGPIRTSWGGTRAIICS